MPTIAQRLSVVQPSAIIKVAGQARVLKEAGKDVVSLSIGVPGFLPPEHVYAAAEKAVRTDSGDYLPGRGSKVLVDAFIASLKERGFSYGESEVAAQAGGKGGLFNLLLALVDKGDEVVVPGPYWASYPEMVKIVGATPVTPIATAEQDYKLTPGQLEKALSAKTKVLLFNNPSNPTGMLYTKKEVAALADVLVKHPDVWIISDDIYDKLVFETEAGMTRAVHLLDVAPELRARMIILQSVSKTYGMPGWRIGMVAAPKAVIDALLTLTSQSITNLPAVTMAAAAAALSGDQSFLEVQKARLKKQRDMALDGLAKLPGITCPVPQGAFYVFPQMAAWFGKTSAGGRKIENDVTLCEALLEEVLLAVVPGGAFGDSGAIRISYAGKEADLVEGMARLKRFGEGLK